MATEVVTKTTLIAEPEPPPSQLLALPAEVRNNIYEYLFTDVKLGIATVHTASPFCGSFCDCHFPWQIVNTCHQLRREAMTALLAATTLEVTGRVEKATLLPAHFISSISRAIFLDAKLLSVCPVSLDRFQSLEILELRNISVWCKYYEESYLASEDANECMFNLAMFNLGRISPALLQICHNEDRKFKVLLGCQFVGSSMTHETVQAVIDVDNKEVLQKCKGATIRSRNEWAGFY